MPSYTTICISVQQYRYNSYPNARVAKLDANGPVPYRLSQRRQMGFAWIGAVTRRLESIQSRQKVTSARVMRRLETYCAKTSTDTGAVPVWIFVLFLRLWSIVNHYEELLSHVLVHISISFDRICFFPPYVMFPSLLVTVAIAVAH